MIILSIPLLIIAVGIYSYWTLKQYGDIGSNQ